MEIAPDRRASPTLSMGINSPSALQLLKTTNVCIDQDEADETRSQYMGSQSSDNDLPNVEASNEQERLLRKIEVLVEKIKSAMKAKEADVDEFLRLSGNLSKYSPNSPQVVRVRLAFNKKNRKSTQLINNLQKKLQIYQCRLKDLDEGVSLRRGITETMLSNVGQGLRGVGANIKESLSGYTESVMSVPKDLTKRLLLKSKSSSVEDFPTVVSTSSPLLSGRSQTMPERSAVLESEVNDSTGVGPLLHPSPARFSYDSAEAASFLDELKNIRSDQSIFVDELSALRGQLLQEYNFFHGALHEERCRYQRLEEQLNDSTELHQAEVMNLKHDVQTLEGRMQYQFRDQLQDLQELIARSQDKMDSLEKSVKDLQQAVGLDNMSNVNASGQALRALLLFLQIIIFLLFALWQVASPCFRTRTRLFATILVICVIIGALKNWDSVQDTAMHWLFGHWFVRSQTNNTSAARSL